MKKLFLLLFLIPLFASAQSVRIGDILCTDGTTVNPTDFPSSGKVAEGIVFFIDNSGQNGWAVNLHRDAIDIDWINPDYYEVGYDIPQLPNCDNSIKGLFDLDGYSNTAIIRMTGGPEWYPAAWCVDFDNGWYLPAAGQMRWLLAYVKEMNESLAVVNGEPFQLPYPDWHWTSTEMSEYHSKIVSRIGTVSDYMKWNYLDEFNIGVRSVKDFSCNSTSTYKVGDVLTAPDGQKGVVFYVSPDDNSYWLVALNDLPQQYSWGPDTDIPNLDNIGEEWYRLHSEQNGYEATKAMLDAQGDNPMYASSHLDLANGWHIPSSGQLSKLYASLPFIQYSLIQNGGSMPYKQYWCSTECSSEVAWTLDFGVIPNRAGRLAQQNKSQAFSVRPVWCSNNPLLVTSTFTVNACDSYTWNDSTYFESGDYTQQFTSSEGLDSIVTLHLTISIGPKVGEIQGLQNFFYNDYGTFTYTIDSVPGAFGYEWSIDNDWTLHSSSNSPQCSLGIYSKGKGTLTVHIYSECGLIERKLLINHDHEPGIKIFPNPNYGKFNIQLYGLEGTTILEVHDYLGQLIDRFEVQSALNGMTIPYSLSGKAAGVYLISITNGHEHYYKKVVKDYAGSYGMIHY